MIRSMKRSMIRKSKANGARGLHVEWIRRRLHQLFKLAQGIGYDRIATGKNRQRIRAAIALCLAHQ